MGRKSRHSARTGDQKLYANRDNHVKTSDRQRNSDDELSDTERFQKRRELAQDEMLFDESREIENNEESIYGDNVEGVFNLGGGDSDEELDEDDDDISEEDEATNDSEADSVNEDQEVSSSSDDDDDEIAQLRTDLAEPTTAEELLNWGKKKKNYYHGDTADLEIGQEEEDAYLEEEAAKEVLKARYAEMEEDDFVLHETSDTFSEEQSLAVSKKRKSKAGTVDSLADILSGVGPTATEAVDQLVLPSDVKHPLDTLSVEDQRERISAAHPEFFPLIEHFKTSIEELSHAILPVSEQLSNTENSEAVGTTHEGKEYLRHKKLLLLNTALNLTSYLILKNESNADVHNHPIVSRLSSCDGALTKLQDNVETIMNLPAQLEAVVKATCLMNGEELSDDESDSDNVEGDSNDEVSNGDLIESTDNVSEGFDIAKHVSESDDSSSDDEVDLDSELRNETRFAVRPQDIDGVKLNKKKRQLQNGIGGDRFSADFGDDSDNDKTTRASKGLSATMNTITQREKTAAKRAARMGGDVRDEIKARQKESELEDAFGMMDEMLGKASGDEESEDNDFDNEIDGDEFYSAVKKQKQAKKNVKQSLYTVAPKYPSLEETIDGERAISKKILKNRGLVAHKAKINRNPRVKKREQYRKALIRRKGAIREVRTGEVDQYGGESTGIKSGISRSRKLGVK